MDPQATWQELLDAFGRDWQRTLTAADGLIEWLRRDGFPPETVSSRCMGALWNKHVALSACQFAADLARRVLEDPHGIPSGVPFTLSCACCDRDSPSCYLLAAQEGWTRITFTPESLAENYVGLCPDHSDE